MIRDKYNKYDSNCINVCNDNGDILGHISKELAARLAPSIDKGITVTGRIAEITGGGPKYIGCNIEIFIYEPQNSKCLSRQPYYSSSCHHKVSSTPKLNFAVKTKTIAQKFSDAASYAFKNAIEPKFKQLCAGPSEEEIANTSGSLALIGFILAPIVAFIFEFCLYVRQGLAVQSNKFGYVTLCVAVPLFIFYLINAKKICSKCKDRLELKVAFLTFGYESIIGGLFAIVPALIIGNYYVVSMITFVGLNMLFMFFINENIRFKLRCFLVVLFIVSSFTYVEIDKSFVFYMPRNSDVQIYH